MAQEANDDGGGIKEPDDQLEAMSDGAIDQAIQTLERARRGLQHADSMLPEPDSNDEDVNWVSGMVADSDYRAEQAVGQLKWEKRRREEDG